MITSYINPRVDIAFKKIFGAEENKDLLLSLINSIVGKEDQVIHITLLNPYNQKSFKEDKLSILDIKAKGHHGKTFNIEIQITDEADYDKRALYYWVKLYTEQLQEKEDYSTLKKVIGIHILNFTSILESTKYHNIFHITEKETGIRYFKALELHTIELKKFTDNLGKGLKDIGSKIKNSLDLWATFLTKHDLLLDATLSDHLKNIPVNKALHTLDIMNFSKEERVAYEDHLKWLRIEVNSLKKAERKGIEQGRKEGQKEGRKERSLEIASSLIDHGLTLDQIGKVTGLSQEELYLLRSSQK